MDRASGWEFDPVGGVEEGGGAVHRGDLKPCPCGCRVFDVRKYQTPSVSDEGTVWSDANAVKCSSCTSPEPQRVKDGRVSRTREVVIGRLDAVTGKMEITC
jgi:hypothetical protein